MAITVTKIAEEANPNNLASFPDSTASQPAANRALLWGVWAHGGVAVPTISSVAAYGVTWTLLATITVGTTSRLSVYEAYSGSSPTSTIATVTLAAAGSGCSFSIHEIAGADATDFTVQQPTNTGTGTTATITFSALADGVNNAEMMFTGTLVNAVVTPDATATWTEQTDIGHNSPTARLHVQSRIGTDLTATSTWAGSAAWAAIGVELKMAVATGPVDVKTAGAGNVTIQWLDAGLVWRNVIAKGG